MADLTRVSTRDLLEEVSFRMRTTQNSNRGRDLGRLCDEAIEGLAPAILAVTPAPAAAVYSDGGDLDA